MKQEDNLRDILFYCSVATLCLTLRPRWTGACQAPLSSTISQSLLKFISVESVVLYVCYFTSLQENPSNNPKGKVLF